MANKKIKFRIGQTIEELQWPDFKTTRRIGKVVDVAPYRVKIRWDGDVWAPYWQAKGNLNYGDTQRYRIKDNRPTIIL